MSIFDYEDVIARLLDEVCPLYRPGTRAFKPLLAHTLGALCVDPDTPSGRKLIPNRQYNRLDFTDFFDYATSELPMEPQLGDFTDGRIEFFRGFDRNPSQPMLEDKQTGIGLAITDCAIARNRVFVTAITRFKMFNGAAPYLLASLTFAPEKAPPQPGGDPLTEWDRHRIYPPVEGDPEWRFVMSGVYTDHLLSEMEAAPGRPGAATPEQIQRVRDNARSNYDAYGYLFESSCLALHLPAYFDFMYDLIVIEQAPVDAGRVQRSARHGRKKRGRSRKKRYRLIRSVRVIRVHASCDTSAKRRYWKAPTRSFAVVGHWRRLSAEEARGKDRLGRPMVGKTWVQPHSRYQSLAPGDPNIERDDPGVTINVKQTLRHAQDIIEAYRRSDLYGDSDLGAEMRPASPSDEWRANERAKLSAGLRYAIMKRDGFKCRICGRSAFAENNVRLEIDHIIPVEQWGRTVEANLQTLCRECNRGKGKAT